MKKLNYKKPRKNFGSDIPPDNLQFYIPDAGVARTCFRNNIDPRAKFLPSPIAGIKAHVGAGQSIREGYDNIDAYPNIHRADYVQTTVEKFARAETLSTLYQPDTLAEIRLHHVFEHISILDLDRTLRIWNKLLKMGGTVFLEVPDFDACVRRILALDDDARTEIFYRHIFGSQFTAGEYHRNGLTPRRLTRLLEQYGFEVTLAYTQWTFRSPNPLHMNYPFNEPLPDLTVVAKKIGEPSARSNQLWTHESYRERYPNTELHNVSTPGGTHPDEVASYLLRCESSVKNCLQQFIAKLPRDVTLRVITATQAILDRVDASVEILEHDAGGTRLATTLTQMASASADAMCLVGAIQYAVDPMEALRLAVRALRPGGKLYLIPALPSFNNNQARPFFSGLSMEWFTAAFKAVGLHLDEAQGVGGPFDELLSDIAAAVEQLDAAGRQSHPLTAYLRQGRHYPYANWLSHGGHLLDAIPNQNIFCVAGCKVSASGGGDH